MGAVPIFWEVAVIDGPRSAREEEYDDLMRLLERSYERIREFFQNGWPHVWKRENVELKNRFIIVPQSIIF